MKLKHIILEYGIDISSVDIEPLRKHINELIRKYSTVNVVRDIVNNKQCWYDFDNQVAHIWRDIEFETQYWECLFEIGHLYYNHKTPSSNEHKKLMDIQALKFVTKNSIIKISDSRRRMWKIDGKV